MPPISSSPYAIPKCPGSLPSSDDTKDTRVVLDRLNDRRYGYRGSGAALYAGLLTVNKSKAMKTIANPANA